MTDDKQPENAEVTVNVEEKAQSASGAPQPDAAPPPAGPGAASPQATTPSDADAGRWFAIISYIVPTVALIPLLARDNEFSLYHAKQSLILWIAAQFLLPLNFLFCVGQVMAGCGALVALVFMVIGIVNAIGGQMKPLPIIGQKAEEWLANVKKTVS